LVCCGWSGVQHVTEVKGHALPCESRTEPL
jgi:hypothetical protein